MRFFKYLVFILLSTISLSTFATDQLYYIKVTVNFWTGNDGFSTANQVCNAYISAYNSSIQGAQLIFKDNTETKCIVDQITNGNITAADYILPITKSIQCPASGTPLVAWLEKGTTHVPTRLCNDGCTFTGNGFVVEMTNYYNTILQSTGSSDNCTDQYKDDPPPKCDKTDPYGECFVPPDDNCVRASNGSIHCPDNIAPPQNETCNGATYCNRPPQGCGSGYVSGSFNGQLLCVRSAPKDPKNPPDPDTPDDPNNCMNGGSYCPQPPNNTTCPEGYSETTYNGSKICVRNNNDPNTPNPNDPNNQTDNGGGASEPTDGGGDGTGGSLNLKPVIDAINSLKSALLSAITGISTKLTNLLDGQKKTNEHLDKIEDSSQAASESLGDISDATQATSEAIGETNKKLDQIFSDQGKEQIEQLGEQSTDSRLTGAESEMTNKLQAFANTLSYSSSHACISDFTVTNIPHFGSMTVPLSKWCDLLALVKLLLKLAVLMLALKMIDATVRAF